MDSALSIRPTVKARAPLTVLLAVLLALAGLLTSVSPAVAAPSLAVTSTTTTKVNPNSTTTLAGLGIAGGTSSDAYQITVSTSVGTLSFPQTSGLTLAYGNAWSGTNSVTFTGLQTDLNAALKAVKLTVGSVLGQTAKVSITGLISVPGYVYSASNGHFYQYVASTGITWSSARSAAKTKTFLGQTGYLATIPNASVNDLVSTRIQGALNVWFGAYATNTSSVPRRTWTWSDGPLAGKIMTTCTFVSGNCDFSNDAGRYHNWASGEPNNAGGEYYPVTNWSGSIGYWNDLPDAAGFSISGYVIEYGDQITGATSFPGVVSASSDVAVVSAPGAPTQVSATRGNGEAVVTFTAPASNGSPITGYTITTQPGGATTACPGSPCTVTGLTNGTSYTFTVTATNANGEGPPSSATSAVIPATVPDPPTAVSAVGGDESALVSFTAPDNDGGTPITSYTVTSSPGGKTATCPGSPCLIDGLDNGTSYTFTVVANNQVGSSEDSDPTSAVEVRAVPGAPTDVAAAPGNGSATITFTAPEDDGGAEITKYLVTSAPGGLTETCSGSPCVITGLTNGTGYVFTVQAINAAGPSEPSAASDEITPRTVPGLPSDLTVERGDTSAELSFTAPDDDGGAKITGYQVSTDGGKTWSDLDTTGSAPVRATIDGLANGTEYNVAVRAVNAAGAGPATEASNVTPAGKPGAPTGVGAVRGDREATITFTSGSDNGSAITGYTVVVEPGERSISCDGSPCVVTGLDNGTAYTFTVYATNDVGDSKSSEATDPVTPATTPSAPDLQSLVSVNGGLVLSFSPPKNDGGEPVLGYEVSLDGGDTWQPVTVWGEDQLYATIVGLDNGTTYTASVRAINAVGGGAASGELSERVATTPSVPQDVSAELANGDVTVSWKAPESDGGSPITGYQVTAEPGGAICNSLTTSCTFADLTPGVTYTFTVVAINVADGRFGTGYSEPATTEELLVTDVPQAPVGLSVTPGDRILSLAFSVPANDGGRPITGYQASVDGGKTWATIKTTELGRAARAAGAPGLTAKIPGVHNGETFQVAIRGVNANGNGPATASVEVTTWIWFADAVSPADRAKEIAVPKDPTKAKGAAKHTKAWYRSRHGLIAYPAAQLDGRQLQKDQAVLIKGAYFAKKKTYLNATGKKEIKAMASSLTYINAITCEGYAGYGGKKSNAEKFASARAKTVCDAIKASAKQVTSRKTASYAGRWPMVVAGTGADRDANRRVVVVIRST